MVAEVAAAGQGRDLPRRTNQREAAADAYERTLALCGNSAERAYLQRRLEVMLNLQDHPHV